MLQWRSCRGRYFLLGPCRGYITRTSCRYKRVDPCGGGVEYLHRDSASRRRRRKGKSQIGDSKIWSRVPRDSDPRKTALARASGTYKRQTRPFVREGAPRNQERNCQTYCVFRMAIKIWSQAPDGCFIPRQTGRLTVGRNIRLRLYLQSSIRFHCVVLNLLKKTPRL
jgi:hypothetical protein